MYFLTMMTFLGAQQRNASALDNMWTSATSASTAENESAKIAAETVAELKKAEPAVAKPPAPAVSWESSSNGLGTVQNRPSSRYIL
jgi:hypothetical protein